LAGSSQYLVAVITISDTNGLEAGLFGPAGSESELAEAEQRIDEIFKGELEKHARGDADATDTGALGLAMQQLANVTAQRRATLAGKSLLQV
jgi:hypothetical protein